MANKKTKLIGAVLSVFALIDSSSCLADDVTPIPKTSDSFRYVITPYAWLSGVNGRLDYNNTQKVDTTINNSTLLSSLDFGGSVEGEIHYGDWGVMGNAIYTKLNSKASTSVVKDPGLTVNSNTTSWDGIYNLAGTYSLIATSSVYFDLLAGARFLNIDNKIGLSGSTGSYSGDKTLYSALSASDAIGGFRGRVRISDTKAYVPFYLDAGGGSSFTKFTSQQALGIGYALEYADLFLLYNNIYYSTSKNQVSSYINMGGPAVGATFRF